MAHEQMQWSDGVISAAQATVSERANFISRTYSHVFGAIVGFTLLEMGLYTSGAMESISMKIFAMGAGGWLLVLGAFMLVGWFATHTAHSAKSTAAQYFALFAYVAAYGLIFCPMLYIAKEAAPGAIESAALITLLGFAALTGIAFYTKKDFSFLRGVIMWGFGIAFLVIVGAAIFGFSLGMVFSVALVGLAGASILYDTSNILHHYPTNMHVGAALALFGSIALMFWYVLRIAIAMQSD